MRISDWSSDVCSSDLNVKLVAGDVAVDRQMGKRCLGIGLQGLDCSPEVVGTREREDRDGCGSVPTISGRICHEWSGVRGVAVASSPRAMRTHIRTMLNRAIHASTLGTTKAGQGLT